MRDALATAGVAQDLDRPPVGPALRVVSGAGAARPRLLHDPFVPVSHHMALLGHQKSSWASSARSVTLYREGIRFPIYLLGKEQYVLLSFTDRELHRLCSQRKVLLARAGANADCLARLLNEIACADTLALLECLPHVQLAGGRGDVVVTCQEVRVLLAPSDESAAAARARARTTTNSPIPPAKAARVVALFVGDEEINPEGAKWPQ
jgi:hypothetical protein